jgi:predicted nucleotidyltransferase
MLPRSLARVNSVLMLHPEVPLAIADVARTAELKYTPAASALATLERRGLIRRVRRLGQDAFEPNRDDPHYPMAYGTAIVDLALAEALRGEQIQAVFAYGSLARPGGGNAGSDLDLLIIGDIADRDAFIERLAVLGARIGRSIDPFILTPEQFDRATREHDPHVESALAGVRIMGTV